MVREAAAVPQHRYVGQAIKRVEDPRLLRGQAEFIDDLELPGMVHAAFVRSPHPHARIVSIDTSAARALDGVVAVFTGQDFIDLKPLVADGLAIEELLAPPRHPLPTDKVRFVGEAVAVVVAVSPYVAEDGRDLVEVTWEPLPAVLDPHQSLTPDAPLLHEELGTNNCAHIEGSAGDPDRAFAEADHVFTKRLRHGRSTGAPIGLRGVVARYNEQGGGRFTVYSSSQMPHVLRNVVADSLGVSEGRVTIRTPDVGGAFGLTCTVFPEDIVIPALARQLGQPVKWVEDRWENLATSVHSKGMDCTIEIAVDSDGTFKGFRGHFITDTGAYSSLPPTPLTDSMTAATMLPSVYTVEDVAYKVDNPFTNKCQIGSIRGVGWEPGQLLRETAIDEVAHGLGLDPVELRLKNMIGPEPRRAAFGQTYDGGSYKESLELARDEIGYKAFRERQAALRAEGRYVGIGFSPFIEPTGWGTRTGHSNRRPENSFDSATVTMEPDGSVTVSTGLHSHGQGHETTFAQVAADELGVPLEMVRVHYGDTDSAPFGMGTFASRSAVIGTGSITRAAGVVRERLLGLAGEMMEASPEDIELRDGKAMVKGAPGQAVGIDDVARFGYFGGFSRTEEVQQSGLTATAGYDPGETYANGCAAAIVEVDVATGEITLERIVAVEDCGVVLNPLIVKGQVAGAVAMGIGIALLEDLVYEDDGEFVSGSLLHYLYPTTGEVPALTLHNIQTPSAASVNGVKGVGEAGTISTPAAIVNAITDALSPFRVSIERVPVTPMYLLDLLRAEPAGSGGSDAG
ncbi:xanthine dehydrogenase family protein molybdopterin-binding subunit [Streptomyces sp. NPDC001393]